MAQWELSECNEGSRLWREAQISGHQSVKTWTGWTLQREKNPIIDKRSISQRADNRCRMGGWLMRQTATSEAFNDPWQTEATLTLVVVRKEKRKGVSPLTVSSFTEELFPVGSPRRPANETNEANKANEANAFKNSILMFPSEQHGQKNGRWNTPLQQMVAPQGCCRRSLHALRTQPDGKTLPAASCFSLYFPTAKPLVRDVSEAFALCLYQPVLEKHTELF